MVSLHPDREWLLSTVDFHMQKGGKKFIILSETEDGEHFFSEKNMTLKDKVFLYNIALKAEIGDYTVD